MLRAIRGCAGFHARYTEQHRLDPERRTFVCFTRAVNLYDDENGPRRRVARMESKSLWEPWTVRTENVLIPDDRDVREGHNLFYGMPTRYYAGIYWGFLGRSALRRTSTPSWPTAATASSSSASRTVPAS